MIGEPFFGNAYKYDGHDEHEDQAWTLCPNLSVCKLQNGLDGPETVTKLRVLHEQGDWQE